MKFHQRATLPIDQYKTAAGTSGLRYTASMPYAEVVYRLSTEELAAQLKLKPQTLRKRYSQTGAYFGVIPQKLANRRLLWPDDAVSRLAGVVPGSELMQP